MQLIDQRCWHHPTREAVVRCPGCSRFYCRECVVEHLGRMMCSDCVAAKQADVSTASFSYVRWTALADRRIPSRLADFLLFRRDAGASPVRFLRIAHEEPTASHRNPGTSGQSAAIVAAGTCDLSGRRHSVRPGAAGFSERHDPQPVRLRSSWPAASLGPGRAVYLEKHLAGGFRGSIVSKRFRPDEIRPAMPFRALLVQCALQPAGLVVPLPLPWLTAFFRNVALFAAIGHPQADANRAQTSRSVDRADLGHPRDLQSRVSAVVPQFLIMIILVPQLARSFLGIEGDFVRFGVHILSPATFGVALALAWMVIDPGARRGVCVALFLRRIHRDRRRSSRGICERRWSSRRCCWRF